MDEIHTFTVLYVSGLNQRLLQIMLDAVEEVKGIFLITADHGNAEDLVKRNLKTGKPVLNKQGKTEVLTSHTCNPVSASTSCFFLTELSVQTPRNTFEMNMIF